MDDFDVSDFNGVCRLFPLPGVVQFPHSVLPLHIFEPRYREMTEDALESDKLITIVQLRPLEESSTSGVRPVEAFGCLGRIIRHQRLKDGRFRILLHGLSRVHLIKEIESPKQYRLSHARVIADQEGLGVAPEPEVLASLFRKFIVQEAGAIDPEMDTLLAAPLSLSVLTDIIGHALPLPVAMKQRLLDKNDVSWRANALVSWILSSFNPNANADRFDTGFPPPFSRN